MTWLADHWLDALGWGGSALLVYSLLQTSVLRLRMLNAIDCALLIVFNAALSVWPMVGMNAVLVLINTFFAVKLLRQRHDETAFQVLEVGPADQYLRHTLRVHGADIVAFNPDFNYEPSETDYAFLVQRSDEAGGVVLFHQDGQTAHILLDYVTPRYRDFPPGEFVWRGSGLLADPDVRTVITPPGMVGTYYDRLGFVNGKDSRRLEISS